MNQYGIAIDDGVTLSGNAVKRVGTDGHQIKMDENDKDGQLLKAIFYGEWDQVKPLLDSKADPDGYLGPDGEASLQHAVGNLAPEILVQLLQAKADPNRTDDHGGTAL